MQLEIVLDAPTGADYPASDLGYLLHKHPARLHERSVSGGTARVFFTEAGDACARAVLALDVDALGLARKHRAGRGDGPLAQYVSDRAFVANSFLSVAMSKVYAQSMGGRSKERQDLAERALPFTARVVPVACDGGAGVARTLFEPLGYDLRVEPIVVTGAREVFALELSATVRLESLLRHLHVLVPVLDDAKHWWVDADEIETLLAKGAGWLADHPARAFIARRALKRRRALADELLERLDADSAPAADAPSGATASEDGSPAEAPGAAPAGEDALERPIGLHERRLDRVADALRDAGARSVVDLGCGEGKLLQRLLTDGRFERLLGVDPSVHELARAAERLHLDDAGDALRERVALAPGSLSYADRAWRSFDAVALVEVIEHVDPERHGALELIVFGDARPATVVVTTPNRDYNARFERLPAGAFRHPDHRFEWTRDEFRQWCGRVAGAHGYTVGIEPIGDVDEALGGPSQMATFARVDPVPGAPVPGERAAPADIATAAGAR